MQLAEEVAASVDLVGDFVSQRLLPPAKLDVDFKGARYVRVMHDDRSEAYSLAQCEGLLSNSLRPAKNNRGGLVFGSHTK
jgi:hypothetical protein